MHVLFIEKRTFSV